MSVISGSMSAVMGSGAEEDASKRAQESAIMAMFQQQQNYNEEKALRKPYLDIGAAAAPLYTKMLTGGYNMKESPAAQYELQQGTKALNRQLAARGLLRGGSAAQRLSELSSSVAANDYSQQYGRLLDAIKIGTGESASAGASSQAMNSNWNQYAANSANNAQQSGAARASLYSGMGGASSSALGTGMKLYNFGKDNGWWGGAATGIGGTAATDAAVYDSAVGEGSAWALI